jgi:DNA-binding NtrC family response regulator
VRDGWDETLQGWCVLVVEDEMLIAMELESLLERRGCAVLGPAKTMGRALALLDRERPDAALLDLDLNGDAGGGSADGAGRAIRASHLVRRNAVERAGTAKCTNKPVNHQELARTLAQVLEPS